MRRNDDIRLSIRQSGFSSWQVADKLSISEGTLYRWLRRELTEAEKQRISDSLQQLKVERAEDYMKAIAD